MRSATQRTRHSGGLDRDCGRGGEHSSQTHTHTHTRWRSGVCSRQERSSPAGYRQQRAGLPPACSGGREQRPTGPQVTPGPLALEPLPQPGAVRPGWTAGRASPDLPGGRWHQEKVDPDKRSFKEKRCGEQRSDGLMEEAPGSPLSPLYFLRSQQNPEASSRVFHRQGHQNVGDQTVRKVSAQGTARKLPSNLPSATGNMHSTSTGPTCRRWGAAGRSRPSPRSGPSPAARQRESPSAKDMRFRPRVPRNCSLMLGTLF